MPDTIDLTAKWLGISKRLDAEWLAFIEDKYIGETSGNIPRDVWYHKRFNELVGEFGNA